MNFNFTNKTAIATGAASGMGYLFCRRIVECGGNALLVDLNAEALAEKAAEINRDYPGHAAYTVADVRRYDEVAAAAELAVKTFGSIDVAVSFAGGAETRIFGVDEKFPDIPIEIFDWSIDVNLRGQVYLAHAVMGRMREQKSGVFLSVGSVTGEEGCPNNICYSACKSGAMYGMTKSLAKFGAPYGIRCVAVSPGPVLTRPGMAKMKTALGRAAEPIELVNLMLYVASEEGAFFNGVNLLMEGGRLILDDKVNRG